MQLYHLSHTPILYGLENDRRNAKVFSISDYFNVTLYVTLFVYQIWSLTVSGSQILC